MKVKTVFISELGRSFDSVKHAVEDDKRLPSIISTYENDLARMNRGEKFAGKEPTEELKASWKNAIEGYKKAWAAAQKSFEEIGVK